MKQFDMVDQPQGPNLKRLLIAVALTSGVMMAYSYFFAPTPSVPVTQNEPAPSVKPVVEQPTATEVVEQAKAHEQATSAQLALEKKVFNVVEQPEVEDRQRTSYRAQVSNAGGAIDQFALVGFSSEQWLFDATKESRLLTLSSKNPSVSLSATMPFEIISSDSKHISLRHVTKEGLEVVRTYTFLENATVNEEISFKNLSSTPLKVEPVLSATKRSDDVKAPSMFSAAPQVYSLVVKQSDSFEKFVYSDFKDKQKSFSNVKYAGFDEQFFLAAVIPSYPADIDRVELSVKDQSENVKLAQIDFVLKQMVLLQGEKKALTHQFFMGPKQVNLLSSLSTPLDETIDFGWFGVLSRPMLWLLVQIFEFVKNYGLAIIIITFIIKLLTYPLTQKSFSSQQEMKKLQPKLKELQAKFGHDRTLLGQKQMELYRAHGVNPVAGCLPLLIQLPIWFAFFQMLRNSVELFDQPFYWWLTDLTRPDQYYVLPILMGASMFVQQAFTPPPTDQPHMKYVMWGMPIFLTVIMLNMPSGLSLYILTNNLLTIIQQIIIKRTSDKVTA